MLDSKQKSNYMYNEQAIHGIINYAKQKKQEAIKTQKPYLAICQPRRDANETAAQCFVGETPALGINNYSYTFLQVSGELVDVARNRLAEAAIERGAKYILFAGEDTVFPSYAFTHLHALAEANPDAVVSGVYYFKLEGPMIILRDEHGYQRLANSEVAPGNIIENPSLIGIDAMLIPTRILKELQEKEPGCPFFCVVNMEDGETPFLGEDEFFLSLLYKHGYRVLVDTKIQCLHMDLATGKYTAHPAVNLEDYICQIEPAGELVEKDREYIHKRWVDRVPVKQITP